MARGLALLLALALGLLRPGRGQPLRVEPPEPVVALGASLQLTCHLACAHGAPAVQWRGLDTSLGAMQPGARSSVLWVHNASLSAAGARLCLGVCGDRKFQHSVQLRVYAFPDQLSVSPAALVPGRDREVACTARNVTPTDPDALSFSLSLGDRELEGDQALRQEEEEEPQEAEGPLFRVTQRWPLPTLRTPYPRLQCRATLRLPGLELSRHRDLPVLQSQTSLQPPHPTSREPLDVASPLATAQPGPTRSPGVPRSAGACRPEILQASDVGGETSWELLCRASCGPGVAVRWTLAPGGLDAYERKEAGTQAWLRVPLAPSSPTLEGWFHCRVEPGGRGASLYVPGRKLILKATSGPEVVQVPAALWAGSLVLGLLLLAIPAYRLWKHCRKVAEDPANSSTSPASEGHRETGGPP